MPTSDLPFAIRVVFEIEMKEFADSGGRAVVGKEPYGVIEQDMQESLKLIRDNDVTIMIVQSERRQELPCTLFVGSVRI